MADTCDHILEERMLVTHKPLAAGMDPVVSLPAWRTGHVPSNSGLHKDQTELEQEQVMPSVLLQGGGQVRCNNHWEAEGPRLAADIHYLVVGGPLVAGSCRLVVDSHCWVEDSQQSVATDSSVGDIRHLEAGGIRLLPVEDSHHLGEEDTQLVVGSLQEADMMDTMVAVHHSDQLAEGNNQSELLVHHQFAFCGNASRWHV